MTEQVNISLCKVLPSDYLGYGGTVERWADANGNYPDCSNGCKFFLGVEGYAADYGVCVNPDSPRAGLLTFEHQAGYQCFTEDDSVNEEVKEN